LVKTFLFLFLYPTTNPHLLRPRNN